MKVDHVAEIALLPKLSSQDLDEALASSTRLANILKNAKEIGLDVSVIHIPPCLSPCTGDQADG